MTEQNQDDEVRQALSALLPRLWRFAMVLSGARDVAEDLVQSTCVRAIERRAQFRPGTRLDAWTFAIMASLWKSQLRADRIRRGEGFVDAEQALSFDGGRAAETSIYAQEVLRELQTLPEAQRTTLLLVYADGLSYQETADVLDIPIGTVMSRLATARRALAHMKADTGGRQTQGAGS